MSTLFDAMNLVGMVSVLVCVGALVDVMTIDGCLMFQSESAWLTGFRETQPRYERKNLPTTVTVFTNLQ